MATNIPVTPAAGAGGGFIYAENADLDLRWGKVNVDKWADANNNKNAAEIVARRGWALGKAERHINSRLRGALYAIPFAAVPDTPAEIRDLVVTFAGIFLYQSPRGLIDGEDTSEAMKLEKDDADIMLRNIIAGVTHISGAAHRFADYPAVVIQQPQ